MRSYKIKINILVVALSTILAKCEVLASVDNILSSINASKKAKLPSFIFALGIRFVGEQTARILANHYKNISNLKHLTYEELIEINDSGPKVSESIHNAFKSKEFLNELDELIKAGIQFEENDKPKLQSLKDLNIVVTGSLPIGRNEIKQLILDHGGKSAGSVSKKTDYVLAGEAAGSKIEKAQDLGVKILSWDQFQELIKGDQ